MHKIRLLCGSIAVTIATHKNSKIQRLSEFFLMRIGACFATFAILSYTKIIDNNWYLRHLFSYFLFGIQWGLLTLNNLGDVGAYDYCRFPIAFSNKEYSIVANHQGTDALMAYQLVTEINSTYCVLCAKNYSGGKSVPWILNWIAIGT